MSNSVFDDFTPHTPIPTAIVKKYRVLLPNGLIDTWEQHGLGSFKNGYIKLINPDDYEDILVKSYFRHEVSVPIFVTGMGDVINFEENKYIRIVKYRYGTFDVIPTTFDWLLSDLLDRDFCDRHLCWEQYNLAVAKYGSPDYDECFGYVPLLGAGGAEKVENLQKVKIREHIELITALMGPIGADR